MLKAYLEESTSSPKIKDVDKLELFELDILSKEQLAPHAPSATGIDEFNRVLGAQEQAPVKFSSSPVQQSSETTVSAAEPKLYATGEINRFQLLAAAVDALVNVTEDQLLTTLTENDYKELVAALDKLIDAVGDSENHLLSLLMHFIGKLIEKYEEGSNPTDSDEPNGSLEEEIKWGSGLPSSIQSLEAAYGDNEPGYTLDMLISVNPDYAGLDEKGAVDLRLPARGLEAAYSNDEPEYTLDMLISANPDYDEQ